jgi:hypothetical protein
MMLLLQALGEGNGAIKKLNSKAPNSSSTVEEHLPHHPKVQDLNPDTDSGIGRDKMAQ